MVNSYVIVFGIFLPIAALVVESLLGICRGVFFNPIPSVLHSALVLTVPIGNALLFTRTQSKGYKPTFFDLFLAVLVLAITAIYAIAFVPILVPGLIGIVFMGIGLLAFAPLSSFIAGLILLRRILRLKKQSDSMGSFTAVWSTGGLSAIFCCIAGVLWSCCGQFPYMKF